MSEWQIRFHDAFEAEFIRFKAEIQDALLTVARLLADYGPRLGRPHADTLNGSRYPNMKELRFRAGQAVWRVAFAFDPARQAILLVAGDKAGTSETRFYKQLIATADSRYSQHLSAFQPPERKT